MVHPKAFTRGAEAGGLKDSWGYLVKGTLSQQSKDKVEPRANAQLLFTAVMLLHEQFSVCELWLTIATATHMPSRSPSHLPLLSPPFHSLLLWVCCPRDAMKGTAMGEDPP